MKEQTQKKSEKLNKKMISCADWLRQNHPSLYSELYLDGEGPIIKKFYKPIEVVYCGVCGVPPEFCKFINKPLK